jgi:hypothetical protein
MIFKKLNDADIFTGQLRLYVTYHLMGEFSDLDCYFGLAIT